MKVERSTQLKQLTVTMPMTPSSYTAAVPNELFMGANTSIAEIKLEWQTLLFQHLL